MVRPSSSTCDRATWPRRADLGVDRADGLCDDEFMGERLSDTATFLFTDIEGSTRLWEERPDEMRAALVEHDALLTTRTSGISARAPGPIWPVSVSESARRSPPPICDRSTLGPRRGFWRRALASTLCSH